MEQISEVEAQAALGHLLDQVEQGREVVITRDGKPVARLVAALASPDGRGFIEGVEALRESMKARSALLTLDEIIGFRNEGRH